MRTLRVTLIGLLFAVPAHADIGLPMIAIVWPSMWAVLIPITVVEGAVLKSRLNLSVSTGLTVAFRANLISTAAGIPLTWGILVLMEMVFDHGGGVNTLWQNLVLCAVHPPWLFGPASDLYWMVPAATLMLIPVAGTQEGVSTFRRAVCLANMSSYGLLLIIAVIWLLLALNKRGV